MCLKKAHIMRFSKNVNALNSRNILQCSMNEYSQKIEEKKNYLKIRKDLQNNVNPYNYSLGS